MIGRGRSHIQFDGIANRHIFYSSLAGLIGVALASDSEASEIEIDGDTYSTSVDEIYTNPYPGKSVFNYLTVSHWAGDDSWFSLVDWANPCEWLALGGDVGRSIDRETAKELVGVILTISKNGQPYATITLDPSGKLISAASWENGEIKNILSTPK